MAKLELDEEMAAIRRALRQFQFDPKYNSDWRAIVSIGGIAQLLGTCRDLLYQIRDGTLPYNPSPRYRSRINYVIDLIKNDGLRWRRKNFNQVATPLMPDGTPPKIPADLYGRGPLSEERERVNQRARYRDNKRKERHPECRSGERGRA